MKEKCSRKVRHSLLIVCVIVIIHGILNSNHSTQFDITQSGRPSVPRFTHITSETSIDDNIMGEGKKDEIMNLTEGKNIAKLLFQIAADENVFTVLTMTYKRTDILPQFLEHYAAMKCVHKIVMLWNNIGERVPLSLWDAMGTRKNDLIILPQSENKITNRMKLPKEVDTTAIFMVDDHLLMKESDLLFSHQVWKKVPGLLVGHVPRLHKYDERNKNYTYFKFGKHYSMILTGSAFMHRDHFKLWRMIPEKYYEMIDNLTNCEDIVMNFFNALHQPDHVGAIFVSAKRKQLNSKTNRGLWKKHGHLNERHFCLTKLFEEYGASAMSSTNIAVRQL